MKGETATCAPPAPRETIPCGQCGGTGRVALPAKAARVLALVRKGVGRASDIYRTIGGRSPTAPNNILEQLRAWGFVARERRGPRGWIYLAVKR